MRLFSRAPLLLVLFLSKSFADVSPSMDEIFAAENLQGVLGCAALIPEDRRVSDDMYCGKSVPTFDSRSGKAIGLAAPTPIYLTGGEGIGNVFVYDQRKASETDSYFLVDSSEGRVWVRAKTKDLYALDAAMPDDSGGIPTKFDLNPRLREVYLTKDAKQPIPVENLFALKNNPNQQIGVVEIVLDVGEVRNPASVKSLRFSYPGQGEKTLSSYALFQASEAAAKSDPTIDPFKIRLPVFRKTADRYLVQILGEWAGLLYERKTTRFKGAIESSISPFEGAVYGWIEASDIALNWRAGAKDQPPSYQQESPSVDFVMDRGPNFERGGVLWTSISINALYLDFDDPHPRDMNGNEDVLSRRKVLLREVFLPLYDAQKRIQLWTSWEPGC